MRFSKEKYWSFIKDDPDCWYSKIDGEEADMIESSNLLMCGGYFVLKEWCEPINDSDNSDK